VLIVGTGEDVDFNKVYILEPSSELKKHVTNIVNAFDPKCGSPPEEWDFFGSWDFIEKNALLSTTGSYRAHFGLGLTLEWFAVLVTYL
jgi:hypothetical protein